MRSEVTEGQLSSAHGVMVTGGRNNVNALQRTGRPGEDQI
jgi:hypothetical protein